MCRKEKQLSPILTFRYLPLAFQDISILGSRRSHSKGEAMNVIEEVECICGTTVEISEFHLGLRRETVPTKAPCRMCGRTLYEVDIDGIVLVEVVLDAVKRPGAAPPGRLKPGGGNM